MAEIPAEIARILASLPEEDARTLEEYFLPSVPVARRRGRPCKPSIPKQCDKRDKLNKHSPEYASRIVRLIENWKVVLQAEGRRANTDTAVLTWYFLAKKRYGMILPPPRCEIPDGYWKEAKKKARSLLCCLSRLRARIERREAKRPLACKGGFVAETIRKFD